jgi:hypothetical protein
VNDLVPILMSQANMLWDPEKCQLIELLLLKYADFWIENRTWKLNFAYIYFMQPRKMVNTIVLSAPLFLGEQNMLDVEAIIIANFCFAHVIIERNEMADNLINRLTENEAAKLKEVNGQWITCRS